LVIQLFLNDSEYKGKPYKYMFHVKKMSVEDFAFAVHLSDTMNWNLVEEDFAFAMKLEPDGCFVLLYDSEEIGMATTISFGQVGWLGNVIVSESHRGRGGGSRLVEHSIKYLKNKGVKTIGLYGYLERIPFYKTHNFVYDSEFIVLKGEGFSAPTKAYLKEAEKEDIPEIVDFDRLCFGASRRKLLEPIIHDTDNLCYVLREGELMLGFAVAKVYDEAAEIGPLVCRQGCSDGAIDLLKVIFNRLKGFEVSMCIAEKEFVIINTLKRYEFRENFHLARMFHGTPIINDNIYIAESLERG